MSTRGVCPTAEALAEAFEEFQFPDAADADAPQA
jgi:hypothetical protein